MNSQDLQDDKTEMFDADEVISNSSGPIEFTYGFIILYNWNERVKKPFKVFSINLFNNEIQEQCISHTLKGQFRMKVLKPLKALPDQQVSLFAKVEACK